MVPLPAMGWGGGGGQVQRRSHQVHRLNGWQHSKEADLGHMQMAVGANRWLRVRLATHSCRFAHNMATVVPPAALLRCTPATCYAVPRPPTACRPCSRRGRCIPSTLPPLPRLVTPHLADGVHALLIQPLDALPDGPLHSAGHQAELTPSRSRSINVHSRPMLLSIMHRPSSTCKQLHKNATRALVWHSSAACRPAAPSPDFDHTRCRRSAAPSGRNRRR